MISSSGRPSDPRSKSGKQTKWVRWSTATECASAASLRGGHPVHDPPTVEVEDEVLGKHHEA